MNVKKLSLIALFTALSVVGGTIKIPAVIGTIALDAFPALVAAAIAGGGYGAAVAAVGHIVSSLFAGMPLGPFHIFIAFEMAVIMWVFALLIKNGNRLIAYITFILGNAIIAPLPFIYLVSNAFYISIVPSLLIGSFLNATLSMMVVPRLYPITNQRVQSKEGER